MRKRHLAGLLTVGLGVVGATVLMRSQQPAYAPKQMPEPLSTASSTSKTLQPSVLSALPDQVPGFEAMGLELMGIAYSSDTARSSALIAYQQQRSLYSIGDEVADSGVIVRAIEPHLVEVSYHGRTWTLRLSQGQHQPDESSEKSQKNKPVGEAQEIGNRPRKLEHIVRPIPGGDSNQGLGVMPGVNPALFASAGFLPGDTLLTVNGLDADDPTLAEAIDSAVRVAHTLKFEVLRNGQRVALFLDIPSETLKIL
ncbi:hypothetical protein DXV75_02275 [Alteromonas aestuariivivens]|uniref:Type II secretion system protein GspC N-terminal domain-containing protein n=1 Tax=Alteromonas aestuariivivens TaxID=1938339 RepID=A0A3D8MGE9_9ALTE|nr:type II secretion system protein N [Alteromonas aestuariivivens]RDV29298.1 hypothetical protein DXV75_02275 [Alteromonas aestuariivivens]